MKSEEKAKENGKKVSKSDLIIVLRELTQQVEKSKLVDKKATTVRGIQH